MADAGDLKSPGGDPIRVRVPARASGGGVGFGEVASPSIFSRSVWVRGRAVSPPARGRGARGGRSRGPLGGGSLRRAVVVLFRAHRLRLLIARGVCSRKRDCCTPRSRRSSQVSFVSRSIMGLIGWSGAVGLWQLGGAVAAATGCGRHSGAGNRDPGDGGIRRTGDHGAAGKCRERVPAAGLPD